MANSTTLTFLVKLSVVTFAAIACSTKLCPVSSMTPVVHGFTLTSGESDAKGSSGGDNDPQNGASTDLPPENEKLRQLIRQEVEKDLESKTRSKIYNLMCI